jgi:hypothetical protein
MSRGRLAGALIATLALGACARPVLPPAALDADLTRERFERALAARENKATGVEIETSLWARGRAIKDPPGMQGRILLAAPDAFRLRIESSFGTALDFGARGDSVRAYAPAAKVGIVLPSSRDSLGLADPGPLGVRLWSATWRPPDRAWEGAEYQDSLLRVRWVEHGDSLELVIGSNGLPVEVRYGPADAATVAVRYKRYGTWQGVTWPEQLEAQDSEAAFVLTARVSRARFTSPPARQRLEVVIPRNAERLTVAGLKRAFQRGEG